MSTWFVDTFGFLEDSRTPTQLSSGDFSYDEGTGTLTVNHGPKSGATFHSGKFELLSSQALSKKLSSMDQNKTNNSNKPKISFHNRTANVQDLHTNSPELFPNEQQPTIVIQAASQFNCLEMIGPNVSPNDGVSNYFRDHTQGPACALSCPSALVYRNYLHAHINRNVGQCTTQIDMAENVGKLLGNQDKWKMSNGYLIPRKGGMGEIGGLLRNGEEGQKLYERCVSEIQVGVQWDTEVKSEKVWKKKVKAGGKWEEEAAAESTAGVRKVCQVYCSGCPVNYTGKVCGAKEWKDFACCALDGCYLATLLAGAFISKSTGKKVTVYLTMVGGGVFGNLMSWVVAAVRKNLVKVAGMTECFGAELEIVMVHYSPPGKENAFVLLEKEMKSTGG